MNMYISENVCVHKCVCLCVYVVYTHVLHAYECRRVICTYRARCASSVSSSACHLLFCLRLSFTISRAPWLARLSGLGVTRNSSLPPTIRDSDTTSVPCFLAEFRFSFLCSRHFTHRIFTLLNEICFLNYMYVLNYTY